MNAGLGLVRLTMVEYEIGGDQDEQCDDADCGPEPASRRPGRGFGYPGNRRFGSRLDFGFTRRLSATAPRIEFFGQCIHRAPLIVQMPVDWHPLFLLPALDGAHVAAQVGSDFLPRFKALLGSFLVGISNDGSAIALSGAEAGFREGANRFYAAATVRQKTVLSRKCAALRNAV